MPDSGYVHSLFSSIAERYVLANHVLSMGMDILWRLRVLECVSEWRPAHLLDVATGTGDLALSIKREFPEIDIVGTDFCESMLQIARRRGLEQTFCADAMQLPVEDGRFDVVTVAFGLRNMENYASALQEFEPGWSPPHFGLFHASRHRFRSVPVVFASHIAADGGLAHVPKGSICVPRTKH